MWKSYIAIGDSVTEGYGDPAPDVELRGWTDWLAEGLTERLPGLSYRNLGLRACTTGDVIRSQLPRVLEARPDLVSITAGANDALIPFWSEERFEEEFSHLLEAVTGVGAQIITFAYPDLRPLIALVGVEVPPEWRPYFTRMETTNMVVRRVGERYGAFLLDFARHPSVSDPDRMSADLIHPNALGYRTAGADALRLLSEHFDLPGPDPDS